MQGLNLHRKIDVRLPEKKEINLPLREAGPPNHHDDTVDSDQQVVNKELSLSPSDAWVRILALAHTIWSHQNDETGSQFPGFKCKYGVTTISQPESGRATGIPR